MATFHDYGEQFAKDFVNALREDSKMPGGLRSNLSRRGSNTHLILLEIFEQLGDLRVDGRQLTRSEKSLLFQFTADELGVRDSSLFEQAVLAARNDDFSELIEIVSTILED